MHLFHTSMHPCRMEVPHHDHMLLLCYRIVQDSGKYNMLLDAREVMAAIDTLLTMFMWRVYHIPKSGAFGDMLIRLVFQGDYISNMRAADAWLQSDEMQQQDAFYHVKQLARAILDGRNVDLENALRDATPLMETSIHLSTVPEHNRNLAHVMVACETEKVDPPSILLSLMNRT